MRQQDLVDSTNAAVPQIRRDVAAGYVRAGDRAGIVEDRSAVGSFQDGAAAVADRQERGAKLVALFGRAWSSPARDRLEQGRGRSILIHRPTIATWGPGRMERSRCAADKPVWWWRLLQAGCRSQCRGKLAQTGARALNPRS